MALKPKDRYQHVADFANDLKQIMKALPQPTPPPGTSRPLDPNSTQPDLPMLYDALQAAKEQKQSRRTGHANIFSSTFVAKHTSATYLLTVSAQMRRLCSLQKSAFCPRCGTALGSSHTEQGTDAEIMSIDLSRSDNAD